MNPNIADNWYETFFSGINCEMWERAMTPEWTEIETAFLQDTLNLHNGARLLDIPSGIGRHSIAFAKKGYHVTSVDISEEFIRKMKEQVNGMNLPLEIINGNILTVSLKGPFDGAYCMGNSFGYFDWEGMKIFVEKVAKSLKPGSRFIINSGMVAESMIPNFKEERSFDLGAFVMNIKNSYNPVDGFMVSQLTYIRNGQSETHGFKHYVFTLSEIIRILSFYDLQFMAAYSGTDKQTYKFGDHQVFIVTEKN